MATKYLVKLVDLAAKYHTAHFLPQNPEHSSNMHILEVISVLEYAGYLPANQAGSFISCSVPQFGPTALYTAKYTEFEYFTTFDHYNKRIVNPDAITPTGLSTLDLSLWLVNRDIKVVKKRLAANPTNKRVFRYGSDAQMEAASVSEVKELHPEATHIYECDGFHHKLEKECKCRSASAVVATDVDPISTELETLEAVAKSYEDAMPFAVRARNFEAAATAAELAAMDAERTVMSYTHQPLMNYKKNPPQMDLRNRRDEDNYKRWSTAAIDARTKAKNARAAFNSYVSSMVEKALSAIGKTNRKKLSVMRENKRNGLPNAGTDVYSEIGAHLCKQ